MSNNSLFHVDSHMEGNLFFCACINIPQDRVSSFLSHGISDLLSFEKFVFANANEIDIYLFFADRLFAAFLGLFSILFKFKDSNTLGVLNRAINSVYGSHSFEDNTAIVTEHKQELLLLYLNELEREISSLDEDDTGRLLLARCHELIQLLYSADTMELPNQAFADSVILDYCNEQLRLKVEEWGKDNTTLVYYSRTEHTYSSCSMLNRKNENETVVEADSLESFKTIIHSMAHLVSRGTYDYNNLSEEEKKNIFDLWALLANSRFQSLLPSSFMESIKKIISYRQYVRG